MEVCGGGGVTGGNGVPGGGGAETLPLAIRRKSFCEQERSEYSLTSPREGIWSIWIVMRLFSVFGAFGTGELEQLVARERAGSDPANELLKESPAPAPPYMAATCDGRRSLSRVAIVARKEGVLAKLTLPVRRTKDTLAAGKSSVDDSFFGPGGGSGAEAPVMGGISMASPTNMMPMQHAKTQPCHHLDCQRQRERDRRL